MIYATAFYKYVM